MQPNNFSKEDMGYVRCIRGLHAMNEVCNFGKSINYFKNKDHTSLGPQHTNPLSVQSLWSRTVMSWVKLNVFSKRLPLCSIALTCAWAQKQTFMWKLSIKRAFGSSFFGYWQISKLMVSIQNKLPLDQIMFPMLQTLDNNIDFQLISSPFLLSFIQFLIDGLNGPLFLWQYRPYSHDWHLTIHPTTQKIWVVRSPWIIHNFNYGQPGHPIYYFEGDRPSSQ